MLNNDQGVSSIISSNFITVFLALTVLGIIALYYANKEYLKKLSKNKHPVLIEVLIFIITTSIAPFIVYFEPNYLLISAIIGAVITAIWLVVIHFFSGLNKRTLTIEIIAIGLNSILLEIKFFDIYIYMLVNQIILIATGQIQVIFNKKMLPN
ncbi:MAG: hypothetical protein GXZ08_04650 [Tissierellia bacterium]|nr:hypothetical protein [Tissierellia bacterium]